MAEKKSKERTFIQGFRRKYDEVLAPADHEFLDVAQQHGFGRPEYSGQDPQIEMGKSLGWLRLTQGSGNDWRETSLLNDPKDRAARIAEYVPVWQSTKDTLISDMYQESTEIKNTANIRTFLCELQRVGSIEF